MKDGMFIFLKILSIIGIIICEFFGLIVCAVEGGLGIFFMLWGGIIYLMYFFAKKKYLKEKLEREKQRKQDLELFDEGYDKVFENLYVNEKEKKLIINGNDYGFSDILDSQINEEKGTLTSTSYVYGNALSSSNTYCKELYINITVNNVSRPSEKIYFKSNAMKKVTKNFKNEAERVQAALQVIIKNGKENYVENGTVTKIEHRYITEEDAMSKIQKLSELHDAGVLTDYEFSIKKQELLDKVK